MPLRLISTKMRIASALAVTSLLLAEMLAIAREVFVLWMPSSPVVATLALRVLAEVRLLVVSLAAALALTALRIGGLTLGLGLGLGRWFGTSDVPGSRKVLLKLSLQGAYLLLHERHLLLLLRLY